MPLVEYVGNAEQVTVPSRLWAVIYGMAKTGKTRLAVQWPEPLYIAELDCDEERLKYVLDKHAPGKKASYDIILPSNQLGISQDELNAMIGRTELVIRAAKAAGEGTLIIDGGNTLYRNYQIAYTGYDFSAGKPQDLKGADAATTRAKFALITQHFDQLLKPMRNNPKLNVVFTTEPAPVWQDGKTTGKYEPRGPDSWEFSFDIELYNFVEGGEYSPEQGIYLPIEYKTLINWCAYMDQRMRGKVLTDADYEKIRGLLI